MKVTATYWTLGETEWGRVYSCVMCSRNVLPSCNKKWSMHVEWVITTIQFTTELALGQNGMNKIS